MDIKPYEEKYREQVIAVWERSVRATHHFVKPEDIDYFKSVVVTIDFKAFDVYCALAGDGNLIGFIGVADKKVEMLFIEPAFIGKGVGKSLLEFAIKELKAAEVDVNEQNTEAVRFYEKFGFRTYDMTEKDSEGKDYPILKMKLEGK